MISTSVKRPPFKASYLTDLFLIGLLVFIIYGTVMTAQRWAGELQPNIQIDLSFSSLPLYGTYSLFRAILAYTLSLSFSLLFGYLAARFRRAEQFILPLLDIGQSIPVIGFLPGLVLGLMSLFSQHNLGLELVCILMIFTGQVWNLAFSFYSSMKGVPKNFHEMSSNVSLSWWQKFVLVELPFSASGLAWNSLMSMAGGWFFLNTCEAFTLGGNQFRLPGLGSYMAVAIEQENTKAIIGGIVAMLILIVSMDFVIWRPIIAWTRRFRIDESPETYQEIPFMQLLWQESRIMVVADSLLKYMWVPRFHGNKNDSSPVSGLSNSNINPNAVNTNIENGVWWSSLQKFVKERDWSVTLQTLSRFSTLVIFIFIFWIASKIFNFLEKITMDEALLVFKSAGMTMLRVFGCLLVSTLWTVPFGLWVGLSNRRTRFFQPLIQIAASFPWPMFYPLALMILSYIGVGLGVGSGFLMLLGVQWYVLFNVLAGATMISRELQETFSLVGLSKKDTWKNLYLPSTLPHLITGLITAAGGAWNTSIVAEYVTIKGRHESTLGLGSLIMEATAKGNYSLLALSLLVMLVVVVSFNRLVWHRIFDVVDRKYRFER